MKTNTLTSISACLLMALSTASFAQMPSTPNTQQLQQNAAQQASQSASQVKQNTAQQVQQGGTQLQQAPMASSASIAKKAEGEAGKINSAVGNLSDDQKTKIKQAFTDYYSARAQNKVTAAGDPAKLKELNAASAKAKMASLKSILTPDQLATWKNAMKAKKTSGTVTNQPVQ